MERECYGDSFKCESCKLVKERHWREACRRQCEYNAAHKASTDASVDDGEGYDIPGQFVTEYNNR